MQVFKLYFKIFRKYRHLFVMYISIFLGTFLGIVSPQATKQEVESYTQLKCDFAVFDYDNSEISQAVIQYLQKIHNLEQIENDEKEIIQDELYIQSVDCVLRINEGFEKAWIENQEAEKLEVFSIPNKTEAVLLKQNLNSYLGKVLIYLNAGFEVEEALEKTMELMNTSIEVTLLDEKEVQPMGILYHFYKYLSWLFIMICVSSITVVLISLEKKEIRNRIQCSSYPFLKINIEIILAVLVTGVAICSFCIAMSMLFYPKEMFRIEGIFYMLNAFCTMAVALSITFLISKLTNKLQVVSLMANAFGLGMAFLGGVFVPLEFLSDTVIQIAHFLPTYWNVKAIELIERYQPKELGTIFLYMGIQLLFAIAILCIGMVLARRKRIINE